MIKIMHYVSVMNRGGQETYLMNLLRNKNDNNIQFEFLCLNKVHGDYDDEIISLNGKLSYLGVAKGKFKIIKNTLRLRKFLKSRKDVDIFEIHTQHAMDAFFSSWAALNAGIKHVIVHSHNSSSSYHPRLHYLFRFFLKILKIRRVACSKSAGNWMFGKNKKFTIFYNGIDVGKYAFNVNIRDRIRYENNLTKEIVFGNIGRFNVQKNHSFLLKIFFEIKKIEANAILILVGDGELRTEIKEEVHSLKLDNCVKFLGVRADVNEIYQVMDGLIMPSLYEGLPVTLVEAQASGLKCFISDTITDEIRLTNLVFKLSLKDSPEKWATEILNSIKIKNNRLEGKKKIENSHYDMKTESKIILKYYRDCVAKYE